MGFIRKNKQPATFKALAYEKSDGSNLIATAQYPLSRLIDYLENQDCHEFLNSDAFDSIKQHSSFSLLRSIFSTTQKQGIGSSLMNEYLTENTDPCLVLVVDLSEGEWLIDFYSKFGYKLVSNDELPVMIKII